MSTMDNAPLDMTGLAMRAPTPEGRARNIILAGMEIAECMRDHQAAFLLPRAEHRVSKLAGIAAGLQRAAMRIMQNLVDGTPQPGPRQKVPPEERSALPMAKATTSAPKPVATTKAKTKPKTTAKAKAKVTKKAATCVRR